MSDQVHTRLQDAVAPVCKDCQHFRVGLYTYGCVSPKIAVKSVDPIDGKTVFSAQYPEEMRERADRCGPEGKWFEPYPYRVPKIVDAPPFLKTLIITAPLGGFVTLGSVLALTNHPVLMCLLAAPVIPVTALLLVMMHERDEPR